jgi:hypothetical protein
MCKHRGERIEKTLKFLSPKENLHLLPPHAGIFQQNAKEKTLQKDSEQSAITLYFHDSNTLCLILHHSAAKRACGRKNVEDLIFFQTRKLHRKLLKNHQPTT